MQAMLEATYEDAHELARPANRTAIPDGDVLELLGDGKIRAALVCLMERHGAAVYRYCRAALRDATLADDVHQQIFIEVFRDLPRFACRCPVRSWLFSIARHRVLDASKRLRRAQAHLEDVPDADALDPRPLPSESLDDARL